ncbi:MAG: hypothetical protein H7X93_00465 [Sphingomonadaceae bacterium]|nr:hypothetical protein [Sphingomonadaceae bacterium]
MTTGLGSINADSYHVDGTQTLYREAAGEGVRLVFGDPATAGVSNSAIDYAGAHMTVSASTATNLITINEGLEGALLVLRATNTSANITVEDDPDNGNIRCGDNYLLANGKSTLVLFYSGGKWLRIGGFIHA